MTQADPGATVIGKVVRILDVLAENGELGLSRLAGESQLAKSTVFRLCEELDRAGLVKRGEFGIMLGDRLIGYHDQMSSATEIAHEVMPGVADLYAILAPKAAVAVHVAVADTGGTVRCVARLAGSQSKRLALGPSVGDCTRWHLVAEGWVIRAFGADESMTPTLRGRADEVRRTGFATQRYDGPGGRTGIGIAVPVVGPAGGVCAAMAVDLADAEGVDFRLIREVVQQSVRASSAVSASFPVSAEK